MNSHVNFLLLLALAAVSLGGCTDNPTPAGVEDPAPVSAEPAFATIGTAPAITHYVVSARLAWARIRTAVPFT
jgi:hypothetical protein